MSCAEELNQCLEEGTLKLSPSIGGDGWRASVAGIQFITKASAMVSAVMLVIGMASGHLVYLSTQVRR